MAEHNILGNKGELIAKKYLEGLGYQIVVSNWRARKFEIDLIVIDKDELVFVEVKTRSTNFFGNPEEAVTLKKQVHLINGAHFYVQQNEIDLECRFDVVAVIHDGHTTRVNHIENAFSPRF